MLVNIIQNTISSFRSALASASVITTNLKMWLGFETSETLGTELVSNGDFSDGTTGWQGSDAAANISISNNRLRLTNGDASAAGVVNSTTTKISFKNGSNYEISYESYQGTSTNKNSQLFLGTTQSGGSSADKLVGEVFTTDGIHKQNFTSTSNQELFLTIKNGITTSGVYMEFDNISVKELSQITPDKSGNNNVGELFTGKAIEFNGTNNYVDISGFSMSGNVSTFAFWINSNDTLGRIIDINPNRFIISFNNNQLSLYDGSWKNFGTISTNVWNRCVIVTNSTSAKCYVNGVQLGVEKTISALRINSATNAIIGAQYQTVSTFFDGEMSDFQIYNAAWTQDDITFDYANPNKLAIDNPSTSLNVTNLKAYWAMSEGAGSLAYNSAVALGNDAVVDGDFPLPNVNWTIGNGTEITASGARVNNTVTGGIAFVKQFLNNTPFGKTFVLTYDVVSTNGNLLVLQQASDLDLDTATIGTNKKFTFSWDRPIDELTIKRKGGQVGATDVTIDNVALQEISVGVINGATYEPAQPRIPQLGMMNWAKSTPVADEITLIPNPNNTTQDIFGNAVRDRLNSFNLDGSGYSSVANNSSIKPTSALSIECWVKTPDVSLASKYISDADVGATRFFLMQVGSKARFKIATTEIDSATNLTNNSWHYIAGTWDGTTMTLYVDEDTPVTIAKSGAITYDTDNLFIGSRLGTGEYFDGLISDVRLYDRALSATEIENNYNAGLSAHTN